ncbi:hypothetical protein DL98DRAFT_531376 [Cadophora sp. DSE1049]|nr:hypothetical protein DL98DRAFT_531376 [Cadophora sp. DSE1049]
MSYFVFGPSDCVWHLVLATINQENSPGKNYSGKGRISPCVFKLNPKARLVGYPYFGANLAGTLDLTAAQLVVDNPANSYWFASWLSADNGKDYFVMAAVASFNATNVMSMVSVADLTEKTYYGTTIFPVGNITIPTGPANPGPLQVRALTPDRFSELSVVSTLPGTEYNLTHVPKGPVLYNGSSGNFIWGTGTTNEFAAPEMYTTGTLTIGDTVVRVIPEQSMTWFDRQWGFGAATQGWNWYAILLENGVKLSIWNTNEIEGHPRQSVATVLYPDGHEEVYPINSDVHASDPFISSVTNLTYYGKYNIEIPLKSTSLFVTLPVHAGEMAFDEDPSALTTLFESFATVTGTFDGESVTGWGLSEMKLEKAVEFLLQV